MKNKINIKIVLLFLIIFICFFANSVHAVDSKVKLEVVKSKNEEFLLPNNQGTVNKEIVSCDAENSKLTVELSLKNTLEKKEHEEQVENMEIIIIVPEDKRMQANGLMSYTETLITKVLVKNPDTKIGIVGLRGPTNPTVKGSADDAELVVNLTNNLDDIKKALNNMNSKNEKYYSDLQSAIKLARETFSNDARKILISLYDGVPLTSIGTNALIDSSLGKDDRESAENFLKRLVQNTKSEVLELKNNNVQFILLRPDDTLFDINIVTYPDNEFLFKVDGKPYADDLYGTIENPTYGKMYSLNNDSLEKIVTEYVYKDIVENIYGEMKNIVIEDYFSEEIRDNFDIEILDEYFSKGASADTQSNSITWKIPNLDSKQSTVLRYVLKLKDMPNDDDCNKNIDINKEIRISYDDYLEKSNHSVIETSPIIKILNEKNDDKKDEDKKEDDKKDDNKDDGKKDQGGSTGGGTTTKKEETPKKDNTAAKEPLPKAGLNTIMIGIIVIATLKIFIMFIKYNKYKDVK